MGKKKIKIEMIQDKTKRHVCFSKRRKGLFQKASELCTLCDAQVAIIVFSGGGRLFVFGQPTADAVIDRFLSATDPVPPPSLSHSELIFSRIAQLQHQLEVVKQQQQQQKKKSQLPMKDEEFTNWWEQVHDVDEGVTCVEELERVKDRLESLRSKVLERINRFYAASCSSSSSSFSAAAACGESVCPPKATGTQSGPLVTMAAEDEWIYGELSEIDSACYLGF